MRNGTYLSFYFIYRNWNVISYFNITFTARQFPQAQKKFASGDESEMDNPSNFFAAVRFYNCGSNKILIDSKLRQSVLSWTFVI